MYHHRVEKTYLLIRAHSDSTECVLQNKAKVSKTQLKKCFKCKHVKPLIEFYKHPRMGDGYLGKCKSCTKNDANKQRIDNLEIIRKYDRNRPNKQQRYNK